MCPVIGDDVTQFIQLINSFFHALQVPTELAMFMIYLAGNYNDLKILLEHSVLLTAKERMRYRFKVLDGINKDLLIKQGLEIELSVMVPNMVDWINNVSNQHFNLTSLLPYYEIMHHVDRKANKPVTLCVPKSYKNTALSFLQYNCNTGAHPVY
ncbi:hypothetical protein Pyn_19351 [Prunus yedoensis var. nudiflora]|uniref:Uncharacterized protein n=1 Tax=Prunus yedoensis var. nudiflora TaxID=2094558 RepID=A0A314ZPS4_PRUYE|nr:hypothetical protein Pyn_19351 [Prunus yedoensis var. nudiflora]